jgi:hypothetical protein
MAAPSSCLEIGHLRKEGRRQGVVPDIVSSGADADKPTLYEIRIKGQLDHHWTDWFGGLAITLQPNGDTLLSGPIVDQAALHGVLRKVRDLGMPLVSIRPRDYQSNGDHHKGEIA